MCPIFMLGAGFLNGVSWTMAFNVLELFLWKLADDRQQYAPPYQIFPRSKNIKNLNKHRKSKHAKCIVSIILFPCLIVFLRQACDATRMIRMIILNYLM